MHYRTTRATLTNLQTIHLTIKISKNGNLMFLAHFSLYTLPDLLQIQTSVPPGNILPSEPSQKLYRICLIGIIGTSMQVTTASGGNDDTTLRMFVFDCDVRRCGYMYPPALSHQPSALCFVLNYIRKIRHPGPGAMFEPTKGWSITNLRTHPVLCFYRHFRQFPAGSWRVSSSNLYDIRSFLIFDSSVFVIIYITQHKISSER